MEAGEKKDGEGGVARRRRRVLAWAGVLLLALLPGCGNGSGSMQVTGGPTAVTFCPNNGCTYNNNNVQGPNNGFNPYGQLNTIVTLLVDGKDNVWIPYNASGLSVLEIPAGNPGSAVTFCQSSCNYTNSDYSGYSPYAYATDANGNFWTLDESNGNDYFLKISSQNPENPALYTCSGCPISSPNIYNIYSHFYMTLDANSTFWITLSGNIYKGTLSGTTVTVTEPYANTGSSPVSTGIAVDQSGNVWASGTVSSSCTGTCNSNSGFVVELKGGSTPIIYCSNGNSSACPSGATPYNQSGALNLSTSYSTPYSSTVTSSSSPAATTSNIAVDGSGNVWVSQYGSNGLLEIPAASPASPILCINGCGDGGTFGGGSPSGIAVDAKGRAWVAGTFSNGTKTSSSGSSYVTPYTGGGLSVFSASGSNLSASSSYCDFSVLSTNWGGCSQYVASMFPQAVAVDSKGNVWIANNGFDNARAPTNNNNNGNNSPVTGWVTELIGAAK